MMTRKIAIIYGLGGSWLDPGAGEAYLLQRCKAIGIVVPAQPFNYGDRQGVYDFLVKADWRGIVGDSFGADFGPEYAGDMAPTKIDYLAGFQPSMYATDVRNGIVMVPDNVVTAHCIRDPNWADTAGLGYAMWVAADPKKTRLITTEHRGAHPDDTGYAQDLVFAEIRHLIGA
jgi:hypothetical protein